ncbi:MAG: alpha-ketoacid dehydrogenase subunit beta [Dehalococcoidia bacterium]|nr:alpha-ketoacid dehydrogenase subunit beta [Dehalococcoidia bacterium]
MAELTIRQAIQRGLEEALQNDPNVFIMGEDIGKYGGAYAVTSGFLEKYGPKRIKDTPISEATFIGAGVGAAAAGLRPVIEIMSISFSLVAFDQIVNMAANLRYMSGGQIKVPMVIRAPTGAGAQLAATHSQSFETWLAEVPGIKCVAPSTPADALGLLRSALSDGNTVIFAEPAQMYGVKGDVPDGRFTVPIGKASVQRSGGDVTLVSYGHGMRVLHSAAEDLAKRGIEAEVVDLRSLSPLDMDTIVASVHKTNRALTLDMARRTGGIMAEVAARLQEAASDWLDGPVARVGAEDVPWPYNRELEQEALPRVEDVLASLKKSYGI